MSADRPPVLVWRRGEALLAAEVDAVLEIVGAAGQDVVVSREGEAACVDLPGLTDEPAAHAIVVRAGGDLVALRADTVDGIRAVAEDGFAAAPSWLEGLAPDHVRAIITLDDDRLAVLLALDAIRPRP